MNRRFLHRPSEVGGANVIAASRRSAWWRQHRGTVSIDSPQPVFAKPVTESTRKRLLDLLPEQWRNYGAFVGIGGQPASQPGFSGSWPPTAIIATQRPHRDLHLRPGHEFTVTLAARDAATLVSFRPDCTTLLRRLPNQQMDCRESRESLNLRFRRTWLGVLDTRSSGRMSGTK